MRSKFNFVTLTIAFLSVAFVSHLLILFLVYLYFCQSLCFVNHLLLKLMFLSCSFILKSFWSCQQSHSQSCHISKNKIVNHVKVMSNSQSCHISNSQSCHISNSQSCQSHSQSCQSHSQSCHMSKS